MDALAARGVVFRNAIAHAPLTLPTHASLFTGTFPPEHGIRDNGRTSLPTSLYPLAAIYREDGFRTGAFISAVALDSTFGLDRGFEVYMDDMGPPDSKGHEPVQRRGAEVTDDAIAWLNRLGEDENFFAFVHYYDAHAKYEAPADFATTGDAYDNELAYVDSQVRRLQSWLESSRRDKDTIVVLIADHGESLGEHGEPTHGALIYQGTQHIPWILCMPDGRWAGTEVTERVGQVDFMPTMLALYDLEGYDRSSGVNLLPLLEGESLGERSMYVESEYCSLNYGWAPLASVVRGKWKLIDAPTPELYDLDLDPGELNNLAAEHPDAVESLFAELEELRLGMRSHGAEAIEGNPELLSALEALGYAGGQPEPSERDGRNPIESIGLLARYHDAVELGHDGEYEQMVPLLEEIVAECPGPIGFRATLASGYIELDRAQEAVDLLEEVLKESPTYEPAHFYAGRAHLRLENLDRALAHFRTNLSLVPGNWRAQIPVAQILTVQEKPQESLEAWRRVVELQPTDPAQRLELAEAWRRVGQWGEMIAELEAALRLAPEDHGTGTYLAWTLATAPVAGVRDGARAVLLAERAAAAGETADRLDTLGAALAEAGRHQEAARAVERALSLLPRNAAELRTEYEARLALYRSGRAFHHR
jgi:arylsulfatase A-like enzyme/thioredoxin-like negative regulator of GroEL